MKNKDFDVSKKNIFSFKKTIVIILISVLVWHVDLNLMAQGEQEIRRQFNLSRKEYRLGLFENAVKRIERLIAIIDNSGQQENENSYEILGGCYLLLGAIHEKMNEPLRAKENYQRAKNRYRVTGIPDLDVDRLKIYNEVMFPGNHIIEKKGIKKAKKKKFPWLLVVGGVAVLGVTVLLLSHKKKKYTLTVNMGAGIEGTPAQGSFQYQKGERVDYSYHLLEGYSNLTVRLDGEVVRNSGSFILDRNRELNITAGLNQVAFITDTELLKIPEGGTGQFRIRLSAQPSSDVEVSVTKLAGSSDIEIVGGVPLTFDTGNWESFQTVTVRSYEDDNIVNDETTIQISATGLESKDILVQEQDNDKLYVNILKPTEGETVERQVSIEAEAGGKYPVKKVEFYIDGELETTDRTPTYNCTWNTATVSEGVHTIKARVIDTEGQTAIHEISVNVKIKGVQYTLKVDVGNGVDGEPGNGLFSFSTGYVKTYSYRLQNGYKDLTVKLDSANVNDSGTIQMNSDHILKVRATPIGTYILTVNKGDGVIEENLENGDHQYNENETLQYNFSLQPGYTGLEVFLDQQPVAPIGIITMNANHQLNATAKRLEFVVDSSSVEICEGKTKSFNISLSEKPDKNVVVSITSEGNEDISVMEGGILEFTPIDWEQPRVVTLFAQQDQDDDSDQSVIVIHAQDIPEMDKQITARVLDDEDDFKIPDIQILQPKNQDTICNNTEIDIKVETEAEYGIQNIGLYIDDELVAIFSEEQYIYRWSTAGLSPGNHVIKAAVMDMCDLTDEVTISVKIEECQ